MQKTITTQPAIFSALSQGAILTDWHGQIIDCNQTASDLFGYEKDEILGSSIKTLYADHIDLQQILNRILPQSGKWIAETLILGKDGNTSEAKTQAMVLSQEIGGPVQYLFTYSSGNKESEENFPDITKPECTNDSHLAHVFRLNTLEEIASCMAHEINQPLTAVINYTRGCLRRLAKGNYQEQQIKDTMEKAVTQAELASEIIHSLNHFFSKGKLTKAPARINKIVKESCKWLRNELTTSQTTISFQLARRLPWLEIDKIQTQRVLLNLMHNAIDAMANVNPKDREITIKTKLLNRKTVELTISDTGPGFSQELLEKVFQPFFTTKTHGSGMGLAISRSIIEAHGGRFMIDRKNGIRFTLPIKGPTKQNFTI